MAKICVALFLMLSLYIMLISAQGDLSTYIVQVSHSDRPSTFTTAEAWYSSAIASVRASSVSKFSENAELSLTTGSTSPLYSYGNVFHGFAARLTSSEAEALRGASGILAVVPDGVSHLHTTRTSEFLGLIQQPANLLSVAKSGEDVIIGVMDSGIWPERRSFDDAGISPIPARWKGSCDGNGPTFPASLCNKKLIGAKFFLKGAESANGPINETSEYKSPRDAGGHGTHTSSTAAGSPVDNANLYGAAPGTARGVAPRARIAMYKVCWTSGCFNSDILAAFDAAVADGVDIISLSVGGGVMPYYLDPIAIGSFGAAQHGIIVSASAGNSGPSPQSVTNVAPWILTIAASTLDRNFPATVTLPTGAAYTGVSINNNSQLSSSQMPVIYAGKAGVPGSNGSANLCIANTLDPALVKGKIVLCDRGVNARAMKGMVVKQAGGAGMILANAEANGEELIVDSHVLPAVLVGYKAGVAIKNYVIETNNPTVSLNFSGTVVGVKPAPVMAAFSSRGPNPANPEILKPDVTAPGVNILAAWTGKVGPTEIESDDRIVEFNILSGTSMSCPHASGVAALLKGAYPHWSPSAIKSAVMTTAYNTDNNGRVFTDGADSTQATPFVYGAGHVDPSRALDPGLVYDLDVQDYIDFLCGLNYTTTMLLPFTKGKYNCSKNIISPSNLNYPSMSFVFTQDAKSTSYSYTVTRTVTHVGNGNADYSVVVTPPPGVNVTVNPTTLSFSRMFERRSYTITCETGTKLFSPGDSDTRFGSLVWSDKSHVVHSPIAFTWQG